MVIGSHVFSGLGVSGGGVSRFGRGLALLVPLLASACDPYAGLSVEQIGQKVYKTQCAACHVIDGSGVPEMQPALAGSEIVSGDEARLVSVILDGSTSEAIAGRNLYSNFMPGFGHLRDFEIAAVATYLRSDFGNQAGPVSEEQVAAQRSP